MNPAKAIELAADMASMYYGKRITTDHILSASRYREPKTARHLAMYMVRELYGKTFKEVGQIFGRDHTTVIQGCRKVQDMFSIKDQEYCGIYELMVVHMGRYKPCTYIAVFPKFCDADKLIEELLDKHKIKLYKYEGAFHEPTEKAGPLFSEFRYCSSITDRGGDRYGLPGAAHGTGEASLQREAV